MKERDFSYKQQSESSRKVWQDQVRKSSMQKNKEKENKRKSRRKSILFGSDPVVVPVFGGPLPISMGNLNSKKPSEQMPAVVRQCAKFIRRYGLKVEGIFRIPGDMQLVSKLQHLYNMRKPVNLIKEVGGGEDGDDPPASFPDSVVYTVATLLKSFFRSLKCPLLSSKDMDRLQGITKRFQEGPDLHQALREFTDSMASPNRQVMRFLIRLLGDITVRTIEIIVCVCVFLTSPLHSFHLFTHPLTSLTYSPNHLPSQVHKDVNRMSADNLAVCFTPSLVFEPSEKEEDSSNSTTKKQEPLDPTETMMAFAKLKPAMEAITKLLEHGTDAIGRIPLMSTKESVLELSTSVRMARTKSMQRRLEAAGVNLDEPIPISPDIDVVEVAKEKMMKKKEPSQHALSPSHHLTLKGVREKIQAAPPTKPPPKQPESDQGAGTRWKVVFRTGVAYRSVYGDIKSRVLHVPGPIYRDIVTALEVRGEWIRVQQKYGDEMYWLPTSIHGLGTILECIDGNAVVVEKKKKLSGGDLVKGDSVVLSPSTNEVEEEKKKKLRSDGNIVKEESVVLSPSTNDAVKEEQEKKNSSSSSSNVVMEKKKSDNAVMMMKEEEEGVCTKDDSALDMAYPSDDDDEMDEPPPAIPGRIETSENAMPEQW